MRTHSIFQIMVKTRLWPVSKGKDGKLKVDLCNVSLAVFFIIYLASVGVYFWLVFPVLTGLKDKIHDCIIYSGQLVLFTVPTLQPLTTKLIGFSVSYLNGSWFNSVTKIGWKSIIYASITILSHMTATILLQE